MPRFEDLATEGQALVEVGGVVVGVDIATQAELDAEAVARAAADTALDGRVDTLENATSAYPRVLDVPFTVHPSSQVQGSWDLIGLASGYYHGGYRQQSSAAVGDEIAYEVAVAAGTYNLTVFYVQAASGCIFQVEVDGVVQGATVDSYNASGIGGRAERTGVVMPGGFVTVSFEVTDKNASSSGYNLFFSGFSLTRTGA